MPGISPKLPLVLDSIDGFALNRTYREVVRQNFKCLMLTSPGERIMDPEFGVGLRSYLFEPKDSFVYDDIQEKIDQQVRKYMPFIEIVDVLFSEPNSPEYDNYLGVYIEYYIVPLGESQVLDLTPG